MKEPTHFVESEIAIRFRTIIMLRVSEGLPENAALLGLLSEMPPRRKAIFLQKMGILLKEKTDEQIVLLLRSRVKTQKLRLTFYHALLLAFREFIEEYLLDDIPPKVFLESESIIRETYGDWHFFLALKLYPINDPIIEARAQELFNSFTSLANQTVKVKTPKQVVKKSDLVLRERSKRIALQETNDQLESRVKELTNEVTRLRKRNMMDQNQFKQLEDQVKELEAKVREVTIRADEAEDRLCVAELRNSELKWEHEEQLRKKESEIQGLHSQLRAVNDRNWLANQTIELLQQDARRLMSKAIHVDQAEFRNLCSQLQDGLKLMEMFEQYFMLGQGRASTENSMREVLEPQVVSPSLPTITEPVENDRVKDGMIGKFIRKPHGGVIEFEDDDNVFITESVVQATGLEHEAIVSYTTKEDGGHHVSLIMQGDDTRSPIHHLLGYISQGEQHEFFCVDVGTKKSYKLHQKDADYWDVRDGEPCLFNIMGGYPFARIGRMYRHEISSDLEDLQCRQVQETSHKKSQTPSEVIEKFLIGCKIVIVGGLEKWFAATIESTGAVLVHNTGHQPQRIFPEIKKANAVFLLLTANSHRATWGAVEIAKKNNVPHFTIQGSRSNLLSLLWEHRKLIASHNH